MRADRLGAAHTRTGYFGAPGAAESWVCDPCGSLIPAFRGDPESLAILADALKRSVEEYERVCRASGIPAR